MQSSVSQDRDLYLGGSDIPALLGISPYKTRYQLLREKAGLDIVQETYVSKYITYGNIMEPKIRDYLNVGRDPDNIFLEAKFYADIPGTDLKKRGHLDGYAAASRTVLEIKTTDRERGNSIHDYPDYLAQILYYMTITDQPMEHGLLAIYFRPEDMNEAFDETRLQLLAFDLEDVMDDIEDLNNEIGMFIDDLNTVKQNPKKSEAELLDKELAEVSSKAVAFEKAIAAFKETEKQYAEVKEKLVELMSKYNIKSFDAGGYQVTRVDAVPGSTKEVSECDMEMLEMYFPDAYETCVKTKVVTSNGKKAYVKVTAKKGGKS